MKRYLLIISIFSIFAASASPQTQLNGINVNPLGGATSIIKFYNAARTHYTGFRAGNPTTDVTFTYPIVDGTTGQAICTNGSAVLGWCSASGLTFPTTFTTSNSSPTLTISNSGAGLALKTTSGVQVQSDLIVNGVIKFVNGGSGTTQDFTLGVITGNQLQIRDSGSALIAYFDTAGLAGSGKFFLSPSIFASPTNNATVGLEVGGFGSGSADIFRVRATIGGTTYWKVDSTGALVGSSLATLSAASSSPTLTVSSSGGGLAIKTTSGVQVQSDLIVNGAMKFVNGGTGTTHDFILSVSTTNQLDVRDSGSNLIAYFNTVGAAGSGKYFFAPTIFAYSTNNATQVMKIGGFSSSQTGDLFYVEKNLGGTVLFKIDSSGALSGTHIQNLATTDSPTFSNITSTSIGAFNILTSSGGITSSNGITSSSGGILSTVSAGYALAASGGGFIVSTTPTDILHGSTTLGNVRAMMHLVDANGTCELAYNVAGVFTCTSDLRLKTNITYLQPSGELARIAQLRPTSFRMKKNPSGDLLLGYIAQDVLPLFPDIIKKDEDGYYSMAMGALIPHMVEAIKELKAEVNILKEKEDTRR